VWPRSVLDTLGALPVLLRVEQRGRFATVNRWGACVETGSFARSRCVPIATDGSSRHAEQRCAARRAIRERIEYSALNAVQGARATIAKKSGDHRGFGRSGRKTGDFQTLQGASGVPG
jgi:hypothetical protein